MRYMMLYKTSQDSSAPPSQEEMTNMGAFIQEMAAAGVLLQTDGLQDSSKGVRVRAAGGKFTVTDGPFTESKELVAGFAIVQVTSKDEAVHWAKRFLTIAGHGESEVREMYDAPAFPPG